MSWLKWALLAEFLAGAIMDVVEIAFPNPETYFPTYYVAALVKDVVLLILVWRLLF